MKYRNLRNVFAVAAVLVLVSTFGVSAMGNHDSADARAAKASATMYQDQWRLIWEDHVTWTRIVIIGVLDGLNSSAVGNYTERLLQNAGDMGALISPFYGKVAGNEFGDLITTHLVQAAGILETLKSGGDPTDQLTAWYQNAHNTSVFMNKLNPINWKLPETGKMWKEHLDATVNETLSNLNHDWNAEVLAYNRIVALAMHMADFISVGVIKQMPQMFTGVSIAFAR